MLSHILPNGKELPLAYYSRFLTKLEKKVIVKQIMKLFLFSAGKKFNQFLQESKFKIIIDYKPLLSLFNLSKILPQKMSP